jgi:hypothetical protein
MGVRYGSKAERGQGRIRGKGLGKKGHNGSTERSAAEGATQVQ